MKIKLIVVALLVVIALLVKQTFFTDGTKPLDRAWAVIDGVNFVGMTVSDLEASTALYSSAADLSAVASDGIDNDLSGALASGDSVSTTSRLMKSVNAQLLFMQFGGEQRNNPQRSPVPVNGPGIAHVCYQVNEETGSYQKFLKGGASIMGDPEMIQLNPKNPVHYAYAKDPDGIMFEVEHVDVAALDLPEPPKNDYRIRHISLSTPDMNRIVKFYSVLLEEPNPRRAGRFFGFSNEKIDKVSGLEGSKIKMSWFQVRNLELEIIEYVSHPVEAPVEPRPLDALGYNMIVFDVKDINKARSLFEKAGGKIVSDVAPMMGGDIVFGRDPDGNLIGLQKVSSASVVSSKNFSGNGI